MNSLLRNATPHLAEALPFVNDEGVAGQLLVLKLQYQIAPGGELQLLPQAESLAHEDRFDEDYQAPDFLAHLQAQGQNWAPLLRPADVMAPQPATNVLLLGHAYAPKADGVKQMEPWLGVGPAVFPMRVHGPRRWRSRWFLTRLFTLFIPRRFKQRQDGLVTRLPLLWQHAYGGFDAMRGRAAAQHWAYNPAGKGFHVDAKAATLAGLALPAIEDPRQPLARWQDRRLPQLPGALNPLWSPRAALGGSRDAQWRATQAPARPSDGTDMFHNTAHPALQFSPHLKGGEAIHAQGFSQDRRDLAFALPRHEFALHSYHYGGFARHDLPLNTVLLEPDRRRLTLLYRAFIPQKHQGQALRRLLLGSAEHPAEMRP
ncbi:DUF2169 family type VI secretion system accessory protein [Roseateles koreensis]|uniref:DUF2169 domain-containing protein n=1 Tax=Roseateles koreensis TaxID=2987526 RepID=A0ABT5KQW8_9BURK|nr:DUF2169 domain-containing protein [Roseateles koreensis]MDC8785306.1 DUF2169 domain-containing protein [Roseateles koreensis]